MGELARERGARDLWVSRGHLYAAAMGVALLCALCFAAGVQYGRQSAVAALPASSAQPPPEGDLVELVARVEATSQPGGGIEKLTFPDALTAGKVDVRVPDALNNDEVGASGAAAPPADSAPAIVPDAPPSGAYSVLVGQFDDGASAVERRDELLLAGEAAWLGVRVVDGKRVWRVAVGGFDSEGVAQGAAAQWAEGGASVFPLR